MSVTKSFPWLATSVLLIAAIGGLVYFDVYVQAHGNFEKSTSGMFLKDTGALEFGKQACDRAMVHTAKGYKWAEANLPEYYKLVASYAKPYVAVVSDLCVLIRKLYTTIVGNAMLFAFEKTPIVVGMINQYAPGLIDSVQQHSLNAWTTVSTFSMQYINIGCDYLKTQVFVGQLSPENLQKVTLEAFNTTQIYAAQYYSWFYEKVNTYSKVK